MTRRQTRTVGRARSGSGEGRGVFEWSISPGTQFKQLREAAEILGEEYANFKPELRRILVNLSGSISRRLKSATRYDGAKYKLPKTKGSIGYRKTKAVKGFGKAAGILHGTLLKEFRSPSAGKLSLRPRSFLWETSDSVKHAAATNFDRILPRSKRKGMWFYGWDKASTRFAEKLINKSVVEKNAKAQAVLSAGGEK